VLKLIVATRRKRSIGAGYININDNVWFNFDTSCLFEGVEFLVADVFSGITESIESDCPVVGGVDGVT
jgi:hypothetical protein